MIPQPSVWGPMSLWRSVCVARRNEKPKECCIREKTEKLKQSEASPKSPPPLSLGHVR